MHTAKSAAKPDRAAAPGTPRLGTLVVATGEHGVLLLLRRKQPNLGLWSPPGGKLHAGESPLAAAMREFREETGLEPQQTRLAAVVSEFDDHSGDEWLVFVFRAEAVGSPSRGNHEGTARWVHLDDLPALAKPPADAHILEAALADDPALAFVEVRLSGGELKSVSVARAPE